MTSKLDTRTASRGDQARAKKYLTEFLPAMASYVIVVIIVVVFGDLESNKPSRLIWAVLPVLPLIAVIWAVVRHLQRIDEYQSRTAYQGLSIGFVGAIIAAMTIGFLQIAGIDIPVAGWMIVSAAMASWVLGYAAILVRKS